jgi:hypothetical protein
MVTTTGLRVSIFITFIFSIFFFTSANSQTNVIDAFGSKSLPGWYWGGNLTMKYSHSFDNAENGYAEISTAASNVTTNSNIGLIRKEEKIQIIQDNILSVMLEGVNNDVNVTVQFLYDINGDFKYEEKNDARLESKPISINYSGWKEVHLNINEEEFKVISPVKTEDISILEEQAIGIQIVYTAGSEFKGNNMLTGIAMISERPNKESKQETASTEGETRYNLKNFPNPFNPETNISYTLTQPSNVKITVYDRLGREVALLFDGSQSEGEHSVTFNASNLTSGIYFYRLKTSSGTEVRKMVLAK